jgi:hypothetical protein
MSEPRVTTLLRQGRERVSRLGAGTSLLELATIAALIGGGLLILSEFLDLFEIEAGHIAVKQQAGGTNHAYAMLIIGAVTIAATLLARSTDQWPPAAGVAALGAFALAFALIGDLPDATRSDLVRGAQIAEAHPKIGFWVELIGAAVTLVAGLVLVRLLRRRENSGNEGVRPQRS